MESPPTVETYVHRIDTFDHGVCVAIRDRVEIVEGKPRKVEPLPEDAWTAFMRMGGGRKACDAFSWEEFASVSGVASFDFAAILTRVLESLTDTTQTQAILRRTMRNFSEGDAREVAARLAADVQAMRLDNMVRRKLPGGEGDGAVLFFVGFGRRYMLVMVAYEPGVAETIRIVSMSVGAIP